MKLFWGNHGFRCCCGVFFLHCCVSTGWLSGSISSFLFPPPLFWHLITLFTHSQLPFLPLSPSLISSGVEIEGLFVSSVGPPALMSPADYNSSYSKILVSLLTLTGQLVRCPLIMNIRWCFSRACMRLKGVWQMLFSPWDCLRFMGWRMSGITVFPWVSENDLYFYSFTPTLDMLSVYNRANWYWDVKMIHSIRD